MQNLSEIQMDALNGGEIDPDCLTWAAVGGGIGALGGIVGAIGGAYIGYTACTTIKAASAE